MLAGLLATGLAGCANPSSGGPGGSGGPPSASSPSSPGRTGLRGAEVTSIRCSSTVWQPDDAAAVALPDTPVRIVICPLAIPQPVHARVDLRPPPADLLQALGLPDGPKPTGTPYACPAYADVPRLVYAELPGGDIYLLHIPVDACGHYLSAALSVINRYAQQGPLTS